MRLAAIQDLHPAPGVGVPNMPTPLADPSAVVQHAAVHIFSFSFFFSIKKLLTQYIGPMLCTLSYNSEKRQRFHGKNGTSTQRAVHTVGVQSHSRCVFSVLEDKGKGDEGL